MAESNTHTVHGEEIERVQTIPKNGQPNREKNSVGQTTLKKRTPLKTSGGGRSKLRGELHYVVRGIQLRCCGVAGKWGDDGDKGHGRR